MALQEFCHNWDNGPDFYFIATPAGARAEPGAATPGAVEPSGMQQPTKECS